MRIRMHRGQNQIGGSIIEVFTEDTRLFFDIGENLSDDKKGDKPNIEGLFTGVKKCDGVFISHYHDDHIGLSHNLLDEIPVYMGEKAYKIYAAKQKFHKKEVLFTPRYIYSNECITIGDIKITPYACDHSACDSYMFLVESNNKKILYTGDFRANGRGDYKKLLSELPIVDAVIIEGTLLNRDTFEQSIKEEELEKIGMKALEGKDGPVFILMSAMNVDRVITAYNIAQQSERLFLEDIYTAEIVKGAEYKGLLPNVKNNIKVFTPIHNYHHDELMSFGYRNTIKREQMPSKIFLMCIRGSMQKYLEKLNDIMPFENGVMFYSMWTGYKEQEDIKKLIDFMKSKGVYIHTLHTSGHADICTIDALINKICPSKIIPVHTENPEWFNKYKEQYEIIYDIKEIEI